MLIAYTWHCGVYPKHYDPEVFSADEQAALETALATGSLKKLMVWHANNRLGMDNRVPGVSSASCTSSMSALILQTSANPALYASVGPNDPSSNAPLQGDFASQGFCAAPIVLGLSNAVAHAWDTTDYTRITAFSFCFQGGPGAVFYSQAPMDAFLSSAVQENADYAHLIQFHANAISVFSNDISCGGPPTCPADVVLSATRLPPNNKMFDVSLTSVALQDPALPGNVTVSSVEFFDVLKGRRPTFPLAVFSPGSSVVSLRAQRNGAGSGRLYRIKYTAANAAGSCGGVAFVCVPHDASAPQATCPIPGSIAEAAWMPTTAP